MESWLAQELKRSSIQSLPVPQAARDLMQALFSHIPANRWQTANVLLKDLQEL